MAALLAVAFPTEAFPLRVAALGYIAEDVIALSAVVRGASAFIA